MRPHALLAVSSRSAFATLLISSIVLVHASAAHARGLEPDYQQWVQVLVDLQLPHKLLTSLDVQSRRMNAPLQPVRDARGQVEGYAQNPNTVVLIRPLIGYQLALWVSVWLGYTFQPNYFDSPEVRSARNIDEHRIVQQVSTSHAFERLALSTRTRLEQRYRSKGPGSPENDAGRSSWASRLRLQVRAQHEFVRGGPWLAIVWDELFFHLNDTNYPSEPGVDQNRAFVGLGYQAHGAVRVELGYMNQFVRRYTDPNQLNHVLNASLALKLDASEP